MPDENATLGLDDHEGSAWYTREATISEVGKGEDRSVLVTASTEGVDSHGTVLRNWDLSRFERNAPVLFCHKRDSWPIGKAPQTRVVDGKLMARLVFAEEDLNPEGEKALRMFRADMIRAVSVGFCQGPRTKVFTENMGGREVIVIDGPQLAEISVLPVGSNEEALAVQHIRALAIGTTVRAVGASYDERRNALQAAVSAKYPPADREAYGPWIREVFEDEVVFDQPSHKPATMWAAPYTYEASTQVAEIGDAYRVRCTYAPIKSKGRASRSVSGLVPAASGELNPMAKTNETATLETGTDERDATIADLQSRAAKLESQLEAANLIKTSHENRIKELQASNAELVRQIAERELDGLVGTKISRDQANRALVIAGKDRQTFDELLAAYRGLPDMVATRETPALSADPNTRTLADVGGESPSERAEREHAERIRAL